MQQTKLEKSNLFQGLLWSKKLGNIDLEKDKVYIIHQILSYGNLAEIKWLFKIYSTEEIRKVFLSCPKRIYSPAVLDFIKNFILNLKDKKIIKENYVKTAF